MKIDARAKVGSPDPRRGKVVDNGGLRYGAMESALRPPLPTATRTFADIQIQARLTNSSGQNIIPSIRGSTRQVADIKSEPRPASNRNRWPASYWNAWPASSESAPDGGSARCNASRAPAQPRNSFQPTPPPTTLSTSNAISRQLNLTACYAPRR
jgi:hypothetical protein